MAAPAALSDVDWSTWEPVAPATLMFVMRGREVLLIRKKRGLGAGKINGPGGKLDPGETPLECAVRETREELGITALSPEWVGEHRFQFTDGYSLHVHVYRSLAFEGTPVETDEAVPLWFSVDAIPYDEMWEDDRHWLPMMFAGQRFSGRFVFDGDRMLDYSLEELD